MRKYLIAIAILLVAAVLILGIYLTRVSTKPTDQSTNNTPADITSSGFIDSMGRTQELTVGEPQTNSKGLTNVTMYGEITNIRKYGDDYKINFTTFIDGEEKKIVINIGNDKNVMSELVSDFDTANAGTYRDGDVVEEAYNLVTARQVYDKFKDQLNQLYRIDLNLELPDKPVTCNATCEANLALFEQYREINNSFINGDLNSVELGSITLISKSK